MKDLGIQLPFLVLEDREGLPSNIKSHYQALKLEPKRSCKNLEDGKKSHLPESYGLYNK
eukprot:c29019_g1_i1 orf=3-176(-)